MGQKIQIIKMIDWKLAEKLKNAGFPQESQKYYLLWSKGCGDDVNEEIRIVTDIEIRLQYVLPDYRDLSIGTGIGTKQSNLIAIPTLDELIEAIRLLDLGLLNGR